MPENVSEAFTLTSTTTAGLTLRILNVSPFFHDGLSRLSTFQIKEKSNLPVINVLNKEGSLIQYLGSQARQFLFTCKIRGSTAQTVLNNLVLGDIYKINLFEHSTVWLDTAAYLIDKHVYTIPGSNEEETRCYLIFKETDLPAFWIKSISELKIPARDNHTFTVSSAYELEIPTRNSNTFTLTSAYELEIPTRESNTFTITSSNQLSVA